MNRRGFFGRLLSGVTGSCAGSATTPTSAPAMPPMQVITSDTTLSPEQMERLRRHWELLHIGAMSTSNVVVLKDGFTMTATAP